MGLESEPTLSGPDGGRFSWPRLAVWIPAALVSGAVAAWIAVLVQSHFAPWLIFPILVGIGLGGMLVGILRFAQVGHRPTLLLGAAAAVAVCVVSQHYFGYLRELEKKRDQEVPLEILRQAHPDLKDRLPEAPSGFVDHLRQRAAQGWTIWEYRIHGPMAWTLWTVDALLLLGAALAVVLPATWQPYCDHCASWYRTIRSGRTSVALIRRAADAARMEIGAPVRSARYRLSSCHGGCGPTRLELSWEEADGSTYLSVGWLNSQRRNQVVQELDQGEE